MWQMFNHNSEPSASPKKADHPPLHPPRRPCGDSGGGTNNAAGGSFNCHPQSCRHQSLTPEVWPETMMAGGKDHFAAATGRLSYRTPSHPLG